MLLARMVKVNGPLPNFIMSGTPMFPLNLQLIVVPSFCVCNSLVTLLNSMPLFVVLCNGSIGWLLSRLVYANTAPRN